MRPVSVTRELFKILRRLSERRETGVDRGEAGDSPERHKAFLLLPITDESHRSG